MNMDEITDKFRVLDADKVKIVGGVAAGIGAVAALPVMGAFGAVSLVGALVGGSVGGLAGVAMVNHDSDECLYQWSEGKSYGVEKCLSVLDELDDDLTVVKEKIESELKSKCGLVHGFDALLQEGGGEAGSEGAVASSAISTVS